MTDHPIRLRGGWELLHSAADGKPERVTLPLDRRPPDWGRTRLVRRFQTPTYHVQAESLWLRLESLPGLRSASLNGRSIAVSPGIDEPTMVPIGAACEARNVLILEVDPSSMTANAPEGPWGLITLIIRSLENVSHSADAHVPAERQALGGASPGS